MAYGATSTGTAEAQDETSSVAHAALTRATDRAPPLLPLAFLRGREEAGTDVPSARAAGVDGVRGTPSP
ncbi:hypothetical protein CSO01_20410 [Cellulomonas soli]|uniref:Uncharacterized protein n=1 Tax=Cellulomonas soli TaxID=931535 RepID=A0A512PDV1_9CELL|nr:hypothetical protein CSO01_20410 [Cellulomonas soli]